MEGLWGLQGSRASCINGLRERTEAVAGGIHMDQLLERLPTSCLVNQDLCLA